MAGENKEFLVARDARIYADAMRGIPTAKIAERFSISQQAVKNAVQRASQRAQQYAITALPQVLRMELERLDMLQAAIFPMTQARTVMIDGAPVQMEPDLKATAQVQSIMRDRAKLLGLEQTTLNVNVETEHVKSTLHGATKALNTDTHDPKAEAQQLIKVLMEAGAFSSEELKMIVAATEQKAIAESSAVQDDNIMKSLAEIEAELGVEDSDIIEEEPNNA